MSIRLAAVRQTLRAADIRPEAGARCVRDLGAGEE
jgi:hypothetical protein